MAAISIRVQIVMEECSVDKRAYWNYVRLTKKQVKKWPKWKLKLAKAILRIP